MAQSSSGGLAEWCGKLASGAPRLSGRGLHVLIGPLLVGNFVEFRNCCAGLILFLLLALSTFGADLTLKVIDKEPPTAIDASIRSSLQPKAIQLLDGDKPVLEFWLRSEIPLRAKPASLAKALDSVKEATLLGAVALGAPQRDYRDDELAAGVYTMRFALQPEDGNHLGTAEYAYFAVLVAAKLDTKLDGIADYKSLVRTSTRGASGDHPMVVSLRPASSEEGDSPKINEPAPEHKSLRLKVPAKFGEEKTALVFELVYEGKGKK